MVDFKYAAGLNHLRPIDEARACIDAALSHPMMMALTPGEPPKTYDDFEVGGSE